MVDSDNWVHGPKKEQPKNTTFLGELFLERMQLHGDKVAQVLDLDGKEESVTFNEILRKSKIVAGLLREHGIKVGDTVMSVFGNTLENAPILFGTWFVGATACPVNPLYETGDLLHLVSTFEPQIVVCNKSGEKCMKEAMKLNKKPDIIFVSIDTVTERIASNPDVSDFHVDKGVDPDKDIATVLCTSGSSGKPKGVEMTHSTMVIQMGADYLKAPADGSQLTAVNIAGPFGNVGQMINLMSVNQGMKSVLVPLERFEDKMYLRLLEKHKVNFIIIGPCQLISLAKSATDEVYDLSSMKAVSVGGSPMSLTMYDMAKKVLKVPITNAYGMTESIGIFAPAYNAPNKRGTSGTIMTNVVAKIVDVETGKALGPNKEGEFCFKSPGVMKGYRNNPEQTKAAFDADGFYRTGDTGYYDEDGYFYFLDRIKELIKYRNLHVPAIEIEEILLANPKVKDAVVIGIYNEKDWEHATGIVIVKEGETLTEEELVKQVQEKLPKYKWMYGGVRFVDSLPHCKGNDKVDKKALRLKFGGTPVDLPVLTRALSFKPAEGAE